MFRENQLTKMIFSYFRRYSFFLDRYSKKIKPYTIIAIEVLIIGIVAGVIFAIAEPNTTLYIKGLLRQSFSAFGGKGSLSLVFHLFSTNLLKLSIASFVGFFLFFIPILFIFPNALIIGILPVATIKTTGIVFFLLAIIPHGTLELSAIILGSAGATHIGVCGLKKLYRDKSINYMKELREFFYFFVMCVIPLLFISACVESFITPLIIRLAM